MNGTEGVNMEKIWICINCKEEYFLSFVLNFRFCTKKNCGRGKFIGKEKWSSLSDVQKLRLEKYAL